ncbi:MAG: FAD-dependent oxidoreductase [Actinomycetota bacterium]|nr:FAD-dependent oxidoreductase [Actinomycetota bacterium]
MEPLRRVVIVGSSLAGLRACETLRQGGFDGGIVLVGSERHPPYDRPPLSKKVLQGEWELDRIHLRKPEALAELGLDERFGETAVALDLSEAERGGTVVLESGERIAGDAVVIATGSRPRLLTDQPSDAHVLRCIEDSIALRRAFAGGGRQVCLVGAGFIGLEAAAAARMAGNEVTVLEALDAPMSRAFGAEVGWAMAAVHEDEGVSIRTRAVVAGFEPGAVVLGDGTRLAADVVLVGIGAAPVTEWLQGSGLTLDDGVLVDAALRTERPGVYAAGDVARWPNGRFGGEVMRVEHWTNAAEQGAVAASNVLAEASGEPVQPYEPVPFVWSDQYRHRIQYLGHARGDDEVEIAVGSVADRRFVALYSRAGRLRAAAGLNSPRQVMPYRALLERGAGIVEARELAASQDV